MFKFRSDIVFRFNLVVILGFLTFAVVIIGSASVTMFKEREMEKIMYNQTIEFKNKPRIIGNYTIVGPKEGDGNFGKYFHKGYCIFYS